jgi:HSP20 family protein
MEQALQRFASGEVRKYAIAEHFGSYKWEMTMANLARRERAFNELFDLRHSFDQIFNRMLRGSSSTGDREVRTLVAIPPIEAWVDNNEKKYHLSIALPGMDANDLQIDLQGNNLTVSGEHKSEAEKKDANYLEREFSLGRFERLITLPEGVDTEKISAEYNNGVLEISAPLSASALPKRIEIKTQPKAKQAGA